MFFEGVKFRATSFNPIRGVYEIWCHPTVSVYVGISVYLPHRITSHFNDLYRGAHPISKLQRDWNVYGPESFTIHIAEAVGIATNIRDRERERIFLRMIEGAAIYNIGYETPYEPPDIEQTLKISKIVEEFKESRRPTKH